MDGNVRVDGVDGVDGRAPGRWRTGPGERNGAVGPWAGPRAGAVLWTGLAVPVLLAAPLGLTEAGPWWRTVLLLGVLAAATAARRTRPVTAVLLVAGGCLAVAPALLAVETCAALPVFALLAGVRAERVGPALAAFAAVLAAGLGRSAGYGADPVSEALVLVSALLLAVVFPWLCGRHWRQRRALAEAGWARAAHLERERRMVAERARLRERARIAREVHDSLGHELSLIALRAGALQLARDLPEHHRAAAAELRSAAAGATDRLRAVVGLLRDPEEPGEDPAPLTPVRRLADLLDEAGAVAVDAPAAAPEPAADAADSAGSVDSVEELVRRAAASGMPVRGERTGRVAPAREVERATRAVVREALTNAAKHAPGARVTVCTAHEEWGSTVTITNEAPPAPPHPVAVRRIARGASAAGGCGLPGLRTRVAALGGTLTAGRHGDGFRVRAHLPPAPAPAAVRGRRRRVRVPAALAVVAAGALSVGAALGWYAYTGSRAVLEPAAYAALRPGADLDALRPVLPERTVADPPVDRAPPRPAGAGACHYYRADGELFTMVAHFRLCFDRSGTLIAKDLVPVAPTTAATDTRRTTGGSGR
ncbi:histidine kinase [Streptomyces sp. NPDC002490]|uniref:sensor histidine kinase n=1 Tax=Streptomyces sp. NPDC002490 TaxID=3154416 RepID=UPI003332C85E